MSESFLVFKSDYYVHTVLRGMEGKETKNVPRTPSMPVRGSRLKRGPSGNPHTLMLRLGTQTINFWLPRGLIEGSEIETPSPVAADVAGAW